MTKEQFSKLEVVGSKVTVTYKSTKHYVIGKDEEEGLLCVVEDDNGRCWLWRQKFVRFENCAV
jgi:hypothetical protein